MDTLVSVIVPVYNVQQYVTPCVESILNQTYKNLEILLVDDGSTDKSGKICEVLAQRDARIKVIHQENGGLSQARNTGLNHMSGEYVMFVDSDDLIKPDCVEDMLNHMVNSSIDLVMCDMCRLRQGKEERYLKESFPEGVINAETAMMETLRGKQINITACAKLYRKKIFTDLKFLPGIKFEDYNMVPDLFKRIKQVYYLDRPYYVYRENPTSIMKNSEIRVSSDIIYVTQSVLQNIQANYPTEVYENCIWWCLKRVWKWIGILYLNGNVAANKEFVSQTKELFRKHFKWLMFQDKNINQGEKAGIFLLCIAPFALDFVYKVKYKRKA